MPISEGIQASIGIVWICSLGIIITALLRSPWVFAFFFGLCYSAMGIARTFGENSTQSSNSDNNDESEEFEMRPLESGRKAFRKDMTLGELLAKY
jgi:hypothetical protein